MKSNIRKTFIAKSLVFASLISSMSLAAFSYDDDATAARAVPVVRALPTGSAHPENELTITATFDDLINRQFDIRMQETIEKFQDAVLDRIAPVGHVLITLNPNNPSTYGYHGSWIKMEQDASLVTSSGSGFLNGSSTGSNTVAVPLPAHNHSGNTSSFNYGSKSTSGVALNKRFWTNTTGNHSHATEYGQYHWQSGNSQFGVLTNSGAKKQTSVAGNHNHFIDVNFGGHSHSVTIGSHSHSFTTSTAGVHGPTIDVRGKYIKVYVWRRVS